MKKHNFKVGQTVVDFSSLITMPNEAVIESFHGPKVMLKSGSAYKLVGINYIKAKKELDTQA